MAVILKIFCLTILLLGFVGSSVLPVDKCNLSDSKCMTTQFQKAVPVYMLGMPELGIETLDPLRLDDLAFDISGLKFSLKEGVLRGLKGTIIDNVKWDLKKKRILVDYHLNGLTKGHYTAEGRIFILPISGDGNIKITFKNIVISMILDYKMEKGADGQDYVMPTKYEYTFEVKDHAHFNLTNLFGGDKTLSDGMHQFLNESWKAVSAEFGKPLMDGAASKLFKSVVKYFKSVPIREIADVS